MFRVKVLIDGKERPSSRGDEGLSFLGVQTA
jgi:hypothetical protein